MIAAHRRHQQWRSGSGVRIDGSGLARQQLLDLVEVANGAVEFLDESTTRAGLRFLISLDTSGITHLDGGISLRERERFEIDVDDEFPMDYPTVRAVHRRWAGTPHVQWGRRLCLYLAPAVEWNPSDGMRGFVSRLMDWLVRAAEGTLDPEGQPLHPPIAYYTPAAGRIQVLADLGSLAPWSNDDEGPRTLFAWSVVRDHRVDVVEWIDQGEAARRVLDPSTAAFQDGKPVIVIPAVLISAQFGSEFPGKATDLSEGLAEHGFTRDELLWNLATSTLMNRRLRSRQVEEDSDAAGQRWDTDDDDENGPMFTAMMVGTPSRRIEGVRFAHLVAWRLDPLGASISDLFGLSRLSADAEFPEKARELGERWLGLAEVTWMRLLEARPEVTRRRDEGTPADWLRGKRALVVGCGALGGPVAEFLVRAGIGELTVADNAVVSTGILVRQPYTDADIGFHKSTTLAARLSTIRPDLEVMASTEDARSSIFGGGKSLEGYDLIVDATADSSVRSAIERCFLGKGSRPSLVTMVISHNAQEGLVTTNRSSATGAGSDTFRKVSRLSVSGASEWADVTREFFPETPRTDIFLPEPGCSAPTFVGSAMQTMALAGQLLGEALRVLCTDHGSGLEAPVSFASAVRHGEAGATGISRSAWRPDLVQTDSSGAFEIRISCEALAEARAEVRRGSRVRGAMIETGGMLLGAYDDAVGVVFIDEMVGPPPDSFLAETYFQHGLHGSQAHVDEAMRRSNNVTGFVGFWHTHPDQHPSPSPTDEQGMAAVVGPDGNTRRALMMIVGGTERWAQWRDGKAGVRPELYLRIVPRSLIPDAAHSFRLGGFDLQQLPRGSYFRGGFGGTERVVAGDRMELVSQKSRITRFRRPRWRYR